MNIDGFNEMYIAELQEARSFEQMLTRALPKMAEEASSEELREAFLMHLDETKGHLETVEGILRRHKADPAAHRDSSMSTIIAETEKMLKMTEKGPLRDAAMIASAQRVEHYEMAVYGTLATYAETLGFLDEKDELGMILEEEEDADEKLSDIATGMVNPKAVELQAGQT